MAADIFDSHKEPDEVFLPLSSERYCQFYDMEMTDFHADLPFYLERIKGPDTVLELGCGTGRLCRQLAASGADITAIDLSLSMLHLAKLKAAATNISYVCMDMTELALSRKFDTVIIPYHTLNLLVTADKIIKCLKQIRTVLKKDGRLLLQLFIPDQTIMDLGTKKLFQFQILEQAGGGKIIKETRRSYTREQLTLEERYRVRPLQAGATNEDLSHTLYLAAFPEEKWQALLRDSGFTIHQQFSGYKFAPFKPGNSSCLFIEANRF
ncbi:MAG: methyltransferase domain-containing protein [Desulfocapsaceae bacterium]|nr:methyltransferase domain-containing protein [Desulfocapsaceae bacterium]